MDFFNEKNENNENNEIEDINVSFLLQEKTPYTNGDNDTDSDAEEEMQKILAEMEDELNDFTYETIDDLEAQELSEESLVQEPLDYYAEAEAYGGFTREYYDETCTVKKLLMICDFYDINKTVKTTKMKKSDIIEAILSIESEPSLSAIVTKRHEMWSHMNALSREPKMRKYIFWS
jgi:hypothetical protein